jgi:hypothetical protein
LLLLLLLHVQLAHHLPLEREEAGLDLQLELLELVGVGQADVIQLCVGMVKYIYECVSV